MLVVCLTQGFFQATGFILREYPVGALGFVQCAHDVFIVDFLIGTAEKHNGIFTRWRNLNNGVARWCFGALQVLTVNFVLDQRLFEADIGLINFTYVADFSACGRERYRLIRAFAT